MTIQDQLTPVNHSKGRTMAPIGICLHTIVGSANSAIKHFQNPAAQVSAHYVIALDGTITRVVREEDRAWAQGNVSKPTAQMVLDRPNINPNEYLISIEHDDSGDPAGSPRSDALYAASAQVVAAAAMKYGIPLDRTHIVGHREIYGVKSCPGNLDMDRIIREAKALLEGEMTDEQVRNVIADTLYDERGNTWPKRHPGSTPNLDSIRAEANSDADKRLKWVKKQDGGVQYAMNDRHDADERDYQAWLAFDTQNKIDAATAPLRTDLAATQERLKVAATQASTAMTAVVQLQQEKEQLQKDLATCQAAQPIPTPEPEPNPVPDGGLIGIILDWLKKLFTRK